jgi:hypothetical protein
VGVSYQRPGQPITPHEGKTLLFGRLRFLHDEREFYPWDPRLFVPSSVERHVWLLRLGGRAASAELHPDPDGSLAIWLASGDYALLGSRALPTSGAPPYEVAALFRVPAGPVAAYAGDLILKTAFHEGVRVSHSELGASSVTLLPIDSARAVLERRFGTLPEPPVLAPWCAGDHLPDFDDPELAARARELLDHGCHGTR